jgi:hypothetical protein
MTYLTASYVRVPDLETTPAHRQLPVSATVPMGGLTDFALLEDMARHDTHLAPLADDTGAVPANHPTYALALQGVHDPDLIPLRDALGDGHDQLDLGLNGLNNGVGGTCGRHVDDRRVRLGLAHRVADGSEDGQAEVGLAGFLRGL